jgi:hypothetical protein
MAGRALQHALTETIKQPIQFPDHCLRHAGFVVEVLAGDDFDLQQALGETGKYRRLASS